MIFESRKEMILELLSENPIVKKEQLEECLNASPSTIQRDLIALEKKGLLIRVWGGARRTDSKDIYRRKIDGNNITDSMLAIGEIAADYIKDDELIFIGPGKTTLAFAECIKAKNVTVITNGIPQLEALSKVGIHVFLLCGFFKEYSRSVVGRQTIKMLESYRFDKAFVGAKGFDSEYRPLSNDEYEYAIKNVCIKNARDTFVLADHHKFNKTAMFVTPDDLAENITIVTDQYIEGNDNFKQEKNGYIWKRKGI
jgi:DeoR family fructose operon transcriptional repressor